LEILFHFAARVLRDLGEVIRLFGSMFVEDATQGYWGTEFEHLLFDIVDQVTDMDVDDVMLRQTLPPIEGETPSQGAVGSMGREMRLQLTSTNTGSPSQTLTSMCQGRTICGRTPSSK